MNIKQSALAAFLLLSPLTFSSCDVSATTGDTDTIEELDPYRCDAPSYMPYYFICNEWTVDTDPKYWDNINAICGG